MQGGGRIQPIVRFNLISMSSIRYPAPLRLSYADALDRTLAALPCPVLVDLDIGHKPPQFVLINGAISRVTWSEAAGGTLEQRLA